ncbi:MAG: PQQ-dependent sugar dehydrogenase [Nitrososphaerales archaeon]
MSFRFSDLICNDCTRKYSAILAVFTILIVISSYSDIYGVTGSADKDYKNGNQNNAEYPIGNKTLVRQDNSTDYSTANKDINLRESAYGGNTSIDLKNTTLSNIQYNYPRVLDSDLKVELVTSGIKFPTHMAFLGQNDILVLEKNDGTVKRVTNGLIQNGALIDVPVANAVERGMLGIAIQKINNGPTFVYLYFTESVKDGDDVSERKLPLGNRLYRYELIQDKLANPKVLLDLPTAPGPAHNGGKLIVGPDGNLYLTIGDLNPNNSRAKNATFSQAQNHAEGLKADGRGGILKITTNGNAVEGGILGGQSPLNKYFAYGIRNSFGIDFDPVTGLLWDTENGPQFGDEINLVRAGFNSGWNRVQGAWEPNGPYPGNHTNNPHRLFDFNGKGEYRTPALTWLQPPPGLTGIKFLNSDNLGKKYENDMFVGDFHNGNIYHFKLSHDRTRLQLDPPLQDKIANNLQETRNVIFGEGFGGITDLEVGPEGYLYVLSLFQGGNDCDTAKYQSPSCISYTTPMEGTIFRIVPNSNK